MKQDQLYQRLTYLEEQKAVIEEEITIIKREIENQSTFLKLELMKKQRNFY